MNQVTSGVKRDASGTALPGYTFAYGFDTIGNRESATRESATEAYTPNDLNQIESINHTGLLHLLGSADASANVTLNTQSVSRADSLYYGTTAGTNSLETITIEARIAGAGHNGTDAVALIEGETYIPAGPTTRSHDESGNLREDARWLYTWDAENRLIQMETRPALVTAGVLHQRLSFGYDSQSRRISKTVEHWDPSTSSFITQNSSLFLWDGWLLLAEINATTQAPQRTYVWGPDISGSRNGSGGVGGLVFVRSYEDGSTAIPLYGNNGNIFSYWSAKDNTTLATFEYGPFGELLQESGQQANRLRHRFSTKPEDTETGFLYYGYRFYEPETGRWLNRDPIQEEGGLNVYGMLYNNTLSSFDILGLLSASDAYEHYVFGNGEDIVMLFEEVNPHVKPSDFQGFDEFISVVCREGAGRNILNLRTVFDLGSRHPSGRLTFFLNGEIRKNGGSGWKFVGRISTVDRERYEFNRTRGPGTPRGGRNPVSELATWIGWLGGQAGRALGGDGGTPYYIRYVGDDELEQEGCCG